MLSLRSLAAILYSAIRLSRAAFLRSPLRSKAPINAQNMATKMAVKMATKMAASMSVSYEQYTPSRLERDIPALSGPKNTINAVLGLSLPKILCSLGGCHSSNQIEDSSSVRPCLSLANKFRWSTHVHESTVRTQILKAQGETARSVADSGPLRQPVVRSGGAAHRPAAPTQRTPFPAAELLVAPVSPSPTKDVFSIGDNNLNTN
jgi:hypothetical protein